MHVRVAFHAREFSGNSSLEVGAVSEHVLVCNYVLCCVFRCAGSVSHALN